MRRLLAIAVLAVVAVPAAAHAGPPGARFRLAGHGLYQTLEVGTDQASSAQYAGIGYGGSVELSVALREKSTAIGVALSVDYTNLNNRANTASRTESLETRTYAVTPRFRAGNVYLGIGLRLSFLGLSSTASGTTTVNRLLLYAGRLETGYVLLVSGALFFQPQLHYDFGKAIEHGRVGLRNASGLAGSASLGVSF